MNTNVMTYGNIIKLKITLNDILNIIKQLKLFTTSFNQNNKFLYFIETQQNNSSEPFFNT